MGPVGITKGSFGSVRFVSPDLERAYISHALQKSLADGKHTPLIAAALFVFSGLMDVALIGNGELSALAVRCLIVKAIWVTFLILSSVVQDAISDAAKSFALIFGWFGSVFVIWYVATLAPADMAKFYVLQLGLASLSMITLLPVLAHWQIPAMNLCLTVPLVERAWHALPGQPADEVWQFVYTAFVLGAICLFTVVSKRSYEVALREDFARRLELAEARDAAMAADDAKSAFLAAASHDMRTPLNAILGNIQVLQTSRLPHVQQEQTLRDAETASRTLLGLVESVLHSASGEEQTARTETVILAELLDELRSNIEIAAAQKGLTFEATIKGDAAAFSADKQKLVQILLNLLNNSAKFTTEGVVGLRLRLIQHRLVFSVYDTGLGMSAADANRAFDPFFLSSNKTRPSGSGFGLGLAITRDIVAILGGSIRLRSQLGRGTIVSGSIPVDRALTRHAPVVAPNRDGPKARLNILVIEDEALNIAVLERMLGGLGQSYTFAQTGALGIKAYSQTDYDCVFVDIQLPDMTGVEVFEALARLPKPTHIPKFAVTANVLAKDLALYKAAGFDDVIPKPIELNALIEALAQVAGDAQVADGTHPQVSPFSVTIENDPALAALYAETALECCTHMRDALLADDHVRVSKMAHRMRGAALYARDEVTVSLATSVEHATQDPLNDWRGLTQNLVLRLQDIEAEPPFNDAGN